MIDTVCTFAKYVAKTSEKYLKSSQTESSVKYLILMHNIKY